MTWRSLEDRIENLPLVLAGPILRRVTTKSVSVWLALKKPDTVRLIVKERFSSTIEGTNDIDKIELFPLPSGTSIEITWRTPKPSTSHVDYGETIDYDRYEDDADRKHDHCLALTGLESGKTYHFRIVAQADDGTVAETGDRTFYIPLLIDGFSSKAKKTVTVGPGLHITCVTAEAPSDLQPGRLYTYDIEFGKDKKKLAEVVKVPLSYGDMGAPSFVLPPADRTKLRLAQGS